MGSARSVTMLRRPTTFTSSTLSTRSNSSGRPSIGASSSPIDQGFPPLHEAWEIWTAEWRSAPAHPGIIQMHNYAEDDTVIAEELHHPFIAGWDPTGALWLFNVKLGWKRLLNARKWTPWAASPLDLR